MAVRPLLFLIADAYADTGHPWAPDLEEVEATSHGHSRSVKLCWDEVVADTDTGCFTSDGVLSGFLYNP